MRLSIKAKSGAVADSLREHAERKVRKLERLFRDLGTADMIQDSERGQHIIELTMEGDGLLLRSQERCPDLFAAVDNVVDKMEKQIKRFKTRVRHDRRRPKPEREAAGALAAIEEVEADTDGEALFRPAIARRKQYVMKPMAAEEAAQHMELLGHSFFMFLNEETDEMNVLYRRWDGTYGIIEPAP